MRREKPRDLGQHRQDGAGQSSLGAHNRAEFAQEKNRRRLASIVGGLPVPCAFRIGTAEGALHAGAQHGPIYAAAAFEIGEKQARGRGDGRGVARIGRSIDDLRRRERGAGRTWHWGTSGEQGRVEPRGALSTPTGSNPFQPSSDSQGRRLMMLVPIADLVANLADAE